LKEGTTQVLPQWSNEALGKKKPRGRPKKVNKIREKAEVPRKKLRKKYNPSVRKR